MLELQIDKSKELAAPVPYEEQLRLSPRWALQEGSMHFDKANQVFRTLERITAKLDENGVPYALAGGLALFLHGYRRFTEDVDLLVTREGLTAIHEKLDGLGYVPPFAGSKNLRDAESGVKIEFLVTGDFPGDGKPKSVAFPDPIQSAEIIGGVRCLNLAKLIELKLASGMSAVHREKDLVDVQELIRVLGLSADFADSLDSSVRSTYLDRWHRAAMTPKEE
jgi:hypothetical protein